jgi:uncharacterized protein (DUF4415 family)
VPDYTSRETTAVFNDATTLEAQPPKVMASMPLDADVLAYFQADSEAGNWQEHMNGVLRFYMETNLAREQEFHAVMAETDRPTSP